MSSSMSERRPIARDEAEAQRARSLIRGWLELREARGGTARELSCELQPALSVSFVRAFIRAVERVAARAPHTYQARWFPAFVLRARGGEPGRLARIEAGRTGPALIHVYPATVRAWAERRDRIALPGVRAGLLAKVIAHEIGHDLYALRCAQASQFADQWGRAWSSAMGDTRLQRRLGRIEPLSAEAYADVQAMLLLCPRLVTELPARLRPLVAQARRERRGSERG